MKREVGDIVEIKELHLGMQDVMRDMLPYSNKKGKIEQILHGYPNAEETYILDFDNEDWIWHDYLIVGEDEPKEEYIETKETKYDNLLLTELIEELGTRFANRLDCDFTLHGMIMVGKYYEGIRKCIIEFLEQDDKELKNHE